MQGKAKCAVVGVDLGCTGDDALMEGLRLLAAGAIEKLHLLHVIDPNGPMEPAYDLYENEARALASSPVRVQQRAKSLCTVYDIAVRPEQIVGHARIGEPAATLLQMCADYDANMLIVGTHGRTGLDRMLDGSVAEKVVRGAHCPVIVARRKDYSRVAKTVLPDLPRAPGEVVPSAPSATGHVHTSTTMDSWNPSDNGPTGYRIV